MPEEWEKINWSKNTIVRFQVLIAPLLLWNEPDPIKGRRSSSASGTLASRISGPGTGKGGGSL